MCFPFDEFRQSLQQRKKRNILYHRRMTQGLFKFYKLVTQWGFFNHSGSSIDFHFSLTASTWDTTGILLEASLHSHCNVTPENDLCMCRMLNEHCAFIINVSIPWWGKVEASLLKSQQKYSDKWGDNFNPSSQKCAFLLLRKLQPKHYYYTNKNNHHYCVDLFYPFQCFNHHKLICTVHTHRNNLCQQSSPHGLAALAQSVVMAKV